MPISAEIIEKCRQFLATGKTVDESIGFMRLSGLSKMECVKMLVDLGHLTPADAKHAVHNSPAWKDAFLRDERLHNDIIELLSKSLSEK